MEVTLRRLLRQRLSTEVVIMMVAILVVTLAVGFVVVQRDLNRQLNQQYEYRSLAVAQALASQPGLQQAVLAGDPGGVGPHGVVQSMAVAAARDTGARFVVVTNAAGIRYSHPNTALIARCREAWEARLCATARDRCSYWSSSCRFRFHCTTANPAAMVTTRIATIMITTWVDRRCRSRRRMRTFMASWPLVAAAVTASLLGVSGL